MTIRKITGNLISLSFGQCIDWIYMQDIRTVALKCKCGHYFCLANHIINENGNVSPSVVCPFNCGFHEFLVIQN